MSLLAIICLLLALEMVVSFRLSFTSFATTISKKKRQINLFDLRQASKTNRNRMIEKWMGHIEFKNLRTPSPYPLLADPELPIVETIVNAADSRKAAAITAFRVYHLTEMTTFMVVMEANSKAQMGAIIDIIEVNFLHM